MQGDILSNVELIENLELTKATATDIQAKVEQARDTEKQINLNREQYRYDWSRGSLSLCVCILIWNGRPVAARAAMMYFLINDLWKINQMYYYSLKAFITVFLRFV
jgi:dynein heavy chain